MKFKLFKKKKVESNYSKEGINKNTLKMFQDEVDKDYLPKEEQGSAYYSEILGKLYYYTLYEEKSIFRKVLERLHKEDFKNIKYDEKNKEWIYDDGKEVLNFNKISNDPRFESIKETLLTSNRNGKCHSLSKESSKLFNECTIITGTVTQKHRKILHSVIEFNDKNNKKKIMDFTFNIIMDSDRYKKIFKFVEISSVKKIDFDKDSYLISKYFNNFDFSYYVLFRDELIKEMELLEDKFDSKKGVKL